MNRKLFLLPLTLAAFAATGCMSLGGLPGAGGNTTGGNNNSGGNNTGGTGSDTDDTAVTPTGTLKATVTMTGCQDMGTEGVFQKNNYKVTVGLGENTQQSIADAIAATKTFEFRVYAKMTLTFEGPSAFNGVLISFSTYTGDSKTYFFDFEDERDIGEATNTYNTSTGKAWLEFDSPASSYTVKCYHQTRISTVAFYA